MESTISYDRINWKSGAAGGTPLSPNNLNNMDAMISILTDCINSLQQTLTNTTDELNNTKQLLNNKVNNVAGKGLSTNDYTNEEKEKLSGISDEANKNVQVDWNTTDETSDAYIKNKPSSLPASDVSDWAKASIKPGYTADEVGAIDSQLLGAAGGVATLNSEGKLSDDQIPDINASNIVFKESVALFPVTGESNTLYIDTVDFLIYFWDGEQYQMLSRYLELGETDDTAYAGDKGKQNAINISAMANELSEVITSLANKMDKSTTPESNDFNELTENGIYSLSTSTNGPISSYTEYTVIVNNSASGTNQLAIDSNSTIYVRRYSSGKWGSWYTFVTTQNIGSYQRGYGNIAYGDSNTILAIASCHKYLDNTADIHISGQLTTINDNSGTTYFDVSKIASLLSIGKIVLNEALWRSSVVFPYETSLQGKVGTGLSLTYDTNTNTICIAKRHDEAGYIGKMSLSEFPTGANFIIDIYGADIE